MRCRFTTGRKRNWHAARRIPPEVRTPVGLGKKSDDESAAAMAVRVVAVPEAEQDVADAYDWYEGRRVGLGEEFPGCLDACIETIRRSP